MLDVKEFIVNASVLIAIIYISGLIYKQFLMNAPQRSKDLLLLGLAVFSGWTSMLFGIHLDDNVIFDLRFIPVIIAALFAKNALFIFIVGFGIGLARLTFGLNEAAVAGMLNVMTIAAAGMLIQLLARKWPLSKRIILTVIVLNLVNVVFVAFAGIIPFHAYFALVTPVALPMNILLSFLIVWMIHDLHHEYISKRNLIESARKDPLTKLYNRRAFMSYFHQFLSGQRGDGPFVLAFIDIDHFKQVNDTHGHLVGDQVLQEVSRHLMHNLRSIDIVARYGGEEFVVILPECTLDNAAAAIDRIRASIAAKPICINDTNIPITFSAGLAASTQFNSEQLLEKADDALYEAKQSGRNKIICAGSEAICS